MESKEQPLVSVLMTAFNREKYIQEAIESVLASTYTNFELIIVDDGSADKTVDIAKSFLQKDSRVKVYVNSDNLGDYPNRNKAAGYASGKYLKYLDSDDIIYPHGLAVMVAAMEKNPEAAVGIASNYAQEEKPFPILLQPAEAYRQHFYVRGVFDTGPSGLIFSTEKFKAAGGFSGKRYIGDTELNLKLAAAWPILKTAASLIFWRQHEGQEFNAGYTSTGYLELQLPMYEAAFKNPVCPLGEKQRIAILSYQRKVAARELIKITLLKRKPGLALQLFRQLRLSMADILNAIFFMKKKY